MHHSLSVRSSCSRKATSRDRMSTSVGKGRASPGACHSPGTGSGWAPTCERAHSARFDAGMWHAYRLGPGQHLTRLPVVVRVDEAPASASSKSGSTSARKACAFALMANSTPVPICATDVRTSPQTGPVLPSPDRWRAALAHAARAHLWAPSRLCASLDTRARALVGLSQQWCERPDWQHFWL